MPLKLNLTKSNLISFTRKPTGGHAKFSSAPTAHISNAMGWTEFGETYKSISATGMLAASSSEFEPKEPDLAKHAFELVPVSTVRDFELIRIQIKKGKSASKNPKFRKELHYVIDFIDPKGAEKLERAIQCGGTDWTLKVSYEPEAVQEEMPLEDKQEVLTDIQKRRAAGKEIN